MTIERYCAQDVRDVEIRSMQTELATKHMCSVVLKDVLINDKSLSK